MKSLRDIILEEMQNDDSYTNFSDCNVIKKVYDSSDKAAQIAVDTIFVRLVGYSLKTLITKQQTQRGE